MGPPPLAARAEHKQAEEAEQSQPTTQGATQVSQRSAVTSLPRGVSPSAVENDASTTKTSDPSNKSSNWSTQATNGFHPPSSQADHDNMPDTQPLSQLQSSGELWPHSQPQAASQGLINPGAILTGSPPQPSSGGGTNRITPGSSKSQHSGPNPGAVPSITNLLNDADNDEPSQSQLLQSQPQSQSQSQSTRNSGSSSSQQQIMVPPESELKKFLGELTNKTSGCTIEQLEQINRELMEEVWHTRNQWNRAFVLNSLEGVFNETIQDIEDLQGMDRPSQ